MPLIRPVSDLKDYCRVLDDVTASTPVFLTQGGRGRYAVVDIGAYERLEAEMRLVGAIVEGELDARDKGWVSVDAARKAVFA